MATKKERYVLAVKDLDKTLADIAAGKYKVPVDKSKYPELFSQIVRRCDSLEGVKKFIRQSGMKPSDCIHWWEGMIDDGYELIAIQYNAPDENFVELAGSEDIVRFVSAVKR